MAGAPASDGVLQGRVVLILAVPARPSVFGEPRYDAGAGPFKVGPGAVIGEYEELVADRAAAMERHRALWEWCRRRGLQPAPELGPHTARPPQDAPNVSRG